MMNWAQRIVLAVAVLGSRAYADCQPGDQFGPCMCFEDANGATALECIAVADGSDVTAALEQIQVAELSSLDIRESPLLSVMPDDAFNSTAVLNLRFYDTGLTELSPSVLGTATSERLTTLYIKHCPDFLEFDTSVVGAAPALLELYVSSTGLTSLAGSLPPTALQYVDFTFNDIQQIDSDFFEAASELTVVLLSFNALTTESLQGTALTFSAPDDDLYLDLGHNSINYGLFGVSFPASSPRELILSGNGISNMTQAGFETVMNQMGAEYENPYILLDSNPLLCGCELQWLMDHPYRALVSSAQCNNGQLVSNLGAEDFTDCP